MKDEILREKLKNLSDEQMSWIDKYCDNNMKKLREITYFAFQGFNLPSSEHEELYDKASDALMESVVSFDKNQATNFNTFLTGNIQRKVKTWYRDNYKRGKRKNLLKDENGKIIVDEKNNPIIIPDISFNAPADEDDVELSEKLDSGFNIENESEKNNYSENVSNYFNSLGENQREIAYLIIEGYSNEEIQRKLSIPPKLYSLYLSDMKTIDKKRLLKTKSTKTKIIKKENINMNSQTTTSENKKDTSFSLAAIIKKLEKNKLRDNHVLQRESGQWKSKAKSELISDILQGNSLTPIIISEEIKNGIPMHWLIDGKQRCTNIHDFVDDGFSISKNVQIYNIEYLTDKLDENGEIIYNEDGFPIPEIRTFDIRNKKFSQLPEELQDKFLEYQLPVMMNLNCTKKKIAYDIARFNRCRPMNVAQNGWTGLDEVYAEYVDNILKMDFFKIDSLKSAYTKGNKTSGAMRRTIVEAIITSKYIDKFDKDFRPMCEFLTNEANESVFIDFYTIIDRLSSIATKETSELFNIKNSFLWFALFDKFTTYKMDDDRFQEFLVAFVNGLKDKKVNNITYSELDENKTTKNKNVVKEKMKHLTYLMNEFLHIDEEVKNNIYEGTCVENKTENVLNEEETVFDFVKENANPEVTNKEIDDCYELIDYAKNRLDGFNKKSVLLDHHNENALIAVFAYALKNNIDLDQWLVKVSNQNHTYSDNQKENYTYMINSLNNYVQAST